MAPDARLSSLRAAWQEAQADQQRLPAAKADEAARIAAGYEARLRALGSGDVCIRRFSKSWVSASRKGIDSSERLGRRQWVVERTMSWLTGYRRLNHRYEREPGNYLAFLGLAAALCCYKRLLKLTM